MTKDEATWTTTLPTVSGPAHRSGKVNLAGIRYRIDVHEGMATFVEVDRMSCARITIQKCEPRGLLYVQASASGGFVPLCHIEKAAAVYESLFGPNHYLSIKDMHRWERNIAARHIWRRPIFKPTQKLFWSYEVRFRIASVWRVIRHQCRLLWPAGTSHVEWSGPLKPPAREEA